MKEELLEESFCTQFNPGDVRPLGWLRSQLEIQASGLPGNLDRIWPDVRDSQWIGGDREGWERVPYWLDGFIPLAWLLDDADMKKRADRYVNAILERQSPDGWICPCGEKERGRYDVWAAFLICKVLMVYHDCTTDPRIVPAVERALLNLRKHLKSFTIFNWAASRWFECLIPIYKVYEVTKNAYLLDLALDLRTQGTSYDALFEDWTDTEPCGYWSFRAHVVNLAMALKSMALYGRINGKTEKGVEFAEQMYSKLMRYHGSAIGHFNGDEVLSGKSPVRGAELCSIVEEMFSFETLYALSGKGVWIDRLEMLAYNSLPATTSPDMWTHQYDQMVNQMACVKIHGNTPFTTNGPDSHIFGLEPNFGCCTANMGQGWPNLARSVFLRRADGVVCGAIAPASVSFETGGASVKITLATEYPFGDSAEFVVSVSNPVEFSLYVRVPGFADSARIDGREVQPGSVNKIRRLWDGVAAVKLDMDFHAAVKDRGNGMCVLGRGPLIFSVPVPERRVMHEYIRDGVERKFPYCDYELFPDGEWQYGFASENFEYVRNDFGKFPFSVEHPPVKILADMFEMDWGGRDEFNGYVAERYPRCSIPKKRVRVALQPYGCTNLRMTEMPRLF